MATIEQYAARWRAVIIHIFLVGGLGSLVCAAQVVVTVSGTVTDESGAVVPEAAVLLWANGTPVAGTESDRVGKYILRVPPGSYDLAIGHKGFKPRREHIVIGFQSAASANVTLESETTSREMLLLIGKDIKAILKSTSEATEAPTPTPPTPTPPTPTPTTPTPSPQHQFKGLTWNVWEEKYSSKPSFEPIQKLLVGKQYSLVLDLSALKYEEETGSISRSISTSFDAWLKGNTAPQATLDVLVVPDERFFQPQRDDERVKKFDIDLEKLRRTRDGGFQLDGSAFSYLKTHNDASFTFGRQSFRIQAKKQTGRAAIALSVWVDGRPVDEISVPLCLVKGMNESCSPAPPPDMGLRGVDAISHGVFPDAALQFIELDSTTVIGVFRCNSCPGWKPDEYRHWVLGRSAGWLSDMLTKTLLPSFAQASQAGDEDAFRRVGVALYGAVFQNNEGNSQQSTAHADSGAR